MNIAKILVTILVITFSQICHTETHTVMRYRGIIRSGPGVIYPAIGEMKQNDSFEVLNTSGHWYEISFADSSGYVSVRVAQKKADNLDEIFIAMGYQEADVSISTHGMSAGVKGFANKINPEFLESDDFINIYDHSPLNVQDYNIFKQKTYGNKDFERLLQIPLPDSHEYDFLSSYEIGTGLGLAAAIAAEYPIAKDRLLWEYVNNVGNLIVEASDVYDVEFRFYVLNTPLINAYSCPGAIILITRGMLEILKDEAELAAVIAHEIAHVSRYHWLEDFKARIIHIKADIAQYNMKKEIGNERPEDIRIIEEDLDNLSHDIYDRIYSGRLAGYELEADSLSEIYCLRAGYRIGKLLEVLERIKHNEISSTNEHYSNQQIEERVVILSRRHENQNEYLPTDLMTNQERFLKFIPKSEVESGTGRSSQFPDQ